jgi:hypothetical protein
MLFANHLNKKNVFNSLLHITNSGKRCGSNFQYIISSSMVPLVGEATAGLATFDPVGLD